jgi:tryptophanase
MEFTRLAVPRRVYTQAHFDIVAEALINVYKNADKVTGYEIVWEPPVLRHFTAKLKPIVKEEQIIVEYLKVDNFVRQ